MPLPTHFLCGSGDSLRAVANHTGNRVLLLHTSLQNNIPNVKVHNEFSLFPNVESKIIIILKKKQPYMHAWIWEDWCKNTQHDNYLHFPTRIAVQTKQKQFLPCSFRLQQIPCLHTSHTGLKCCIVPHTSDSRSHAATHQQHIGPHKHWYVKTTSAWGLPS